MIRFYCENDIQYINKLGNYLHNNYKFKLDIFSKCIVFIDKGNFAGFAVYSIIYERAELVDIIVEPYYRKKGFGTKILNVVIMDAISSNCNNITLEVNVKNVDAIKFYMNFGFKIIRLIKNYYFDKKNNEYFDGYLMELKF